MVTTVATTPVTLITLAPRVAVTGHDAERLRQIRNTCAAFMTGDNRQITPEQQAAWWDSEDRRRNAIWLFVPNFRARHVQPVGFGLFRMEGATWWATLGLLPEWRGFGFGVGIYRHLIAHCPGDLWIRVLLTNPGSARAAEKAGFRPVDSNGVYAELVARRGA